MDGVRKVDECGVHPELICGDCIHRYKEVREDWETCSELFPSAILCGDDDWSSKLEVRAAVEDFAARHELRYVLYGGQYVFLRNVRRLPRVEVYPELARRLEQRGVVAGERALTSVDDRWQG